MPPAGVLANDGDQDSVAQLTAVIASLPSHRTLILNSDGSFTYNPDADFVGVDTFKYQTNNAAKYSSPATAYVTLSGVALTVKGSDIVLVNDDDDNEN